MKTKLILTVLWIILSFGRLTSTVGTAIQRKVHLSPPGTRKSTRRLPASLSPSSSSTLTPGPEPRAKTQSDFAYLRDVSVTCSSSDFVVRVKPAFYGLGADAEELRLGSGCRSNGELGPYGDLLFTYPLTACDGVRELPHGYLVYKFVLHYEPSAKRFSTGAQRFRIDIECRYPRDHHVHQLVLKPTWETVVLRKKLKGQSNDFEIKLMDESWSGPAKSQVYHLGQTVHLQVSAPQLPSEGTLYISSCIATPSSISKSSLKYTIIDNFGCILDSKREPGASQFVSRTHNTLRLSLRAFQFTADPDTEVSIHCKLFVTSDDPGPAHKSCTYSGDRWWALTGYDSICECCESQCVTSKTRRAIKEGSASSLPLLFSDWLHHEDGIHPSSSIKDESSVHHYSDQQLGHEKLLKNPDDEEERLEERNVGVTPDLDGLSFWKGFSENVWNEEEARNSHQFREGGSGYDENGYLESEKEGRIEESEYILSNLAQRGHLIGKKYKRVLDQISPLDFEQKREIRPPDHEEEKTQRGENRNVIDPDVQRRNVSSGTDEMTWFFTWR
ncbi:zona pellucida sperm-binding protein 3 [Gouania willdenowi]|uniref:zona pellucida sperm-binding protein 3 n=1 Tax=Gouania willdenowi TaxID=441366 RepID=UPI0010543F63|nr:zona pellucida sperm-binding protein 3-like [Gouania willdenowi]